MTLKYIFLLISFFITNNLVAQKESSFTILLGSDYHLFEMEELKNNFSNDYLEESNIQNGLRGCEEITNPF